MHDSAAYPVTQTVRGNVSGQLVGNDTVCLNYDNTGRVAFTRNTVNGLSADIGGGPALAVPGAITPNGEANLRTSFSYNSFLGVTTVSGPNGFSANTTYDQYGRVATRFSPHGAGAVESYDYANRKQTTTISNRRVETTMDGLGGCGACGDLGDRARQRGVYRADRVWSVRLLADGEGATGIAAASGWADGAVADVHV